MHSLCFSKFDTGYDIGYYKIRSTEVLDQLGWQQLEDPWSTNEVRLMFKVVHNLVPSYLSEQFSRRDTAHDHNTGGNHVNLSIPKSNTNSLKNSLAYNGAVAWNYVPTDIRYSENIEMFKKKLTFVSISLYIVNFYDFNVSYTVLNSYSNFYCMVFLTSIYTCYTALWKSILHEETPYLNKIHSIQFNSFDLLIICQVFDNNRN